MGEAKTIRKGTTQKRELYSENPGCVKQMKHIKLLNDEGIICCKMCESVNTGVLEHHDDQINGKIEGKQLDLITEINLLKSIIDCKNEIIMELRENNQLLKDKIKLMEKSEQVMPSVNKNPKHCKNEERPVIETESVLISVNSENDMNLTKQNNGTENTENKLETDKEVKKS